MVWLYHRVKTCSKPIYKLQRHTSIIKFKGYQESVAEVLNCFSWLQDDTLLAIILDDLFRDKIDESRTKHAVRNTCQSNCRFGTMLIPCLARSAWVKVSSPNALVSILDTPVQSALSSVSHSRTFIMIRKKSTVSTAFDWPAVTCSASWIHFSIAWSSLMPANFTVCVPSECEW